MNVIAPHPTPPHPTPPHPTPSPRGTPSPLYIYIYSHIAIWYSSCIACLMSFSPTDPLWFAGRPGLVDLGHGLCWADSNGSRWGRGLSGICLPEDVRMTGDQKKTCHKTGAMWVKPCHKPSPSHHHRWYNPFVMGSLWHCFNHDMMYILFWSNFFVGNCVMWLWVTFSSNSGFSGKEKGTALIQIFSKEIFLRCIWEWFPMLSMIFPLNIPFSKLT